MREASAAPIAPSELHTVADLLAQRVDKAPRHLAFQRPAVGGDGPWIPVTTVEFEEDVLNMARGFVAAGLQSGDALAIMSPTSYHWAVAELACAYAALVVVPIYETSAPAQVRSILRDANVRAALAATPQHATLISEAAREDNISLLGLWTTPAAPLVTAQAAEAPALTAEVNRRRAALSGDDLATIVYTSGTTAAPKGVLLTHSDLVEKVRSVAAAFPDVVHEQGSTVILLPLSHILARGLQLCCLFAGMRISHVSNPKEALAALKTLLPTFLVVVSQVMQKIISAVDDKAAHAHLTPLWERAKNVAIRWGQYLENRQDAPGLRAPRWLTLQHWVYDKLFYQAVRAQLGGNIDYLLSGAATLDKNLNRLFLGMGIPIVEGYGLTESTAPLTANRVGDLRPGTVGSAMPGVTIRIADDGEVLVKGCGITSGYRNSDLNAAAFTEDGFFRTGDLGELDERGHLVLRGRVKDSIVTSYGKTVYPTDWETELERNPLVSYALMLGEGRKYVAGMVFVDVATLTQWAALRGTVLPVAARTVPTPGELVVIDVPEVTAEIAAAVEGANAVYSHAESAKRFMVVTADLAPGGIFVTPTTKLRRNVVLERGAQLIDQLYNSTAGNSQKHA